jgi:hypothetical protein
MKTPLKYFADYMILQIRETLIIIINLGNPLTGRSNLSKIIIKPGK